MKPLVYIYDEDSGTYLMTSHSVSFILEILNRYKQINVSNKETANKIQIIINRIQKEKQLVET